MSKNAKIFTSKPPLLLTGTIVPQSQSKLKVIDPNLRARQYKKTIELWCNSHLFSQIIFCENSGYPGNSLINGQVVDDFLKNGGSVDYLTFLPANMNDIQTYGKGLGEIGIIQHALKHSEVLKNALVIVKCTGRLYVKNASKILRKTPSSENFAINANLSMRLCNCDTRFFVSSPTFLKTYLFPLIKDLDDSKGKYIEKVMVRAILRAAADGKTWTVPDCAPWYSGQSGSTGSIYGFPWKENVSTFIKKFLLKW